MDITEPGHRSTGTALTLRPAEKVLGVILLAVVALSVVPFGSNRPWAWLLLAVLVGGLFLIQAMQDVIGRPLEYGKLARLWPALLLVFGVLIWIALQIQTWMPSPLLHDAYALIPPAEATISLQPERSAQFGLRLLCYVMVTWLAVRLGRDPVWSHAALSTIALMAVVLAVYAIILSLAGSNTILWFEKWSPGTSATFVNRNAFATYAGIGLILNLSLLLDALHGTISRSGMTIRVRAREFLLHLGSMAGVYLLGVLLTLTALLMTGSRGGFLATVSALLLFAVLSALRQRGHAVIWTGLVLVGAMFVLLWYAGDLVLERLLTTDVATEVRLEVFDQALLASTERPWLGSGAGTFLEAFRPFKTESLGRVTWDFAHNSYLENAIELGWPATLALVAAIAWLVMHCLRGFFLRRRRHRYSIVAVAVSALVGLHAMVDFSLQMPSIAATFALILGVGCAQSWPSCKRPARPKARLLRSGVEP